MPAILQSLLPGGLLIYETFSAGHEKIGKPSRPDFLLKPGELLQTFAPLRIIAYEDSYWHPTPKYVQRMVAVQQDNESDRQFGLSSR
jgi:hypothetical protein